MQNVGIISLKILNLLHMKTDKRKNIALAGFFLLMIGVVLFVEKLGVVFPEWLFSWEVIVITIGLYIGIKRGFRGVLWIFLIGIGTGFLIDECIPSLQICQYIIPIIVILAGLLLIFKSMRANDNVTTKKGFDGCNFEESISEDVLNSVTVFSGVKKVILSKNFKGGEIVSFMGGSEINMMQADVQGKVVINISQVFSGIKFVIPPHWQVQSEIVSVMGGFQDKRPKGQNVVDEDKVLIIKGTNLLGGIEIKSF